MRLTEVTRKRITKLIKTEIKSGNYLQENYGSYEVIGEGGFGTVYKVRMIEPPPDAEFSGDILGLKRIDLGFECNYSYEGKYPHTSQRDRSTLENFLQSCQEAVLQSETFKHPNIVRVYNKWIQTTPNMVTPEVLSANFLTIIRYLEPVDGSKPRLEKTKLKQHKKLRDALVGTKGWSFFRTKDMESRNQQDENMEYLQGEPTSKLTAEHMSKLMKVGDDGNYLEDNYTIDGTVEIAAPIKVFRVTVNQETNSFSFYSNASQQIVLERIDLDYENDYKSDSYNVISENDQIKLRRFIDCCKEAVSRPTRQIYDNWIQKTPLFSRPEEISDRFITIIEYLESPKYPVFQPGDSQALASIEGLSLYLTMDLYDEDLKTWLEKKRDKSKEELNNISRTIFGDIVSGLKYIHDKHYVHADLKSENILVKYDSGQDKYTAALSDFGLSRLETTPPETTESKMPYHAAPERFFSCKFDLWSLGLIIYQMTIKSNVLHDELLTLVSKAEKEKPEELRKFLDTPSQYITADEHLQQKFHEMITQCLQKNPENRYSASDFDEQDLW